MSGRVSRLVQGAPPLHGAPWARAGSVVEVALGPDDAPPNWPGAVAVYVDSARLGWVNGGGDAMREALREAWGVGAYVVVPGAVEVVQDAPAVRLSLPRASEVAAWVATHGQATQ